jgi:hypothetical protein
VVGADQAASNGETHAGEGFVIRGGPHLATSQTIDLASFGSTALEGHIARVVPPAGSGHYHVGATCQIADLDGNGRGEVLLAAALNRAGATIRANGAASGTAHAVGGAPRGRLYIAWDDNFPAGPWPAGYSFAIDASPGGRSIISGASVDTSFGEEIVGGLDYDGDGNADLFVGDIVGDGSPLQDRPISGLGYVLYHASTLKGLTFGLDSPPVGLGITKFLGGAQGDIATDTAEQGDVDGDGFDDLLLSSPKAAPFGRSSAGTVHVFHGQNGVWPATIDLKPGSLPPPASVRITEIYGALGNAGGHAGDTLGYSAASGDIDGDGSIDLIVNEMLGDGTSAFDVGNLLVISGAATRATKLSGRITYYANQRAVPDVDVQLSQAVSTSVATEVTGRFDFPQANDASAQLMPGKLGGFNNGISSLDAAWAAQNSIGMRAFTALQALACDVTGNGTISSLDVARIRQFEVGMITRLPVAEQCDSDWAFVPAPAAVPNQTAVAPQISGGSCTPGEIDYSPLDTPTERQDFVAVLFGDCTGNWQ